MPAARPCVKPFHGSIRSSAFHVRDEEAFEDDPEIGTLLTEFDVLQGQRPEDQTPIVCFARDFEAGPTLLVRRLAGLTLLTDQESLQADIDDAQGWIAALQRHLDPDNAIVVEEYLNVGAIGFDLFWVILPEMAACSLRPCGDGTTWPLPLDRAQ